MFTPGAIQSPGDPQDYIYSQLIAAAPLPEKFMLDEWPVRDQGKFGTCVGQAAAGVKEWQEAKNYPTEKPALSPLFVYSECKKADGIPEMEGTYPRVAMKVLHKQGICYESTMPYSLMGKPVPGAPPNAYNEAKRFLIGAYARVQTMEELKRAIYRDGPVLGAVLVCQNFLEPGTGGYINMPQGRILGGHAIAVTGWDDHLKHSGRQGFLRVRNSWGPDWGDNGYCWIPYEFFLGRLDTGQPYWFESWSSVDVVLPSMRAREIILWPKKDTALVDGHKVHLDQSCFIVPETGRLMLPARFLAERMGYSVTWDGEKAVLRRRNSAPNA